MEPVTIAIICAAAFGVVFALSAFIRQLLLSRDKLLNDKAQKVALQFETKELANMRSQMLNTEKAEWNYDMLGENKEAIKYIDQKIEDILAKKSALVQRYADIALKVSYAIIDGNQSTERKELCDNLRQEIDKELKQYDDELSQMQQRRASLWDKRSDLQDHLIKQEEKRNEHLASIYTHHSNLLEKVYLRHIEQTEQVTLKATEGSTDTYKHALNGPLELLKGSFSASKGLDHSQSDREIKQRRRISLIEEAINGSDEIRVTKGLSDVAITLSMQKSKTFSGKDASENL